MTLQLQLEPRAESNLQEAAKDRGISAEALAKVTLEQAFGDSPRGKRPNPEGVHDLLAKFAEWGKGLPDLPDSALTRESYYESSSQARAADLDDLFDKLHEWGKNLPDLPDSAITRESFYERD